MSTSRAEPSVRHARAERLGAMLVLAIFFIAIATFLSALMMADMAQLIRTNRHEYESILARQLIDSGRAWALAHVDVKSTLPVTLSGDSLLAAGDSGEVRLVPDIETPDTFVVTATLRLSSRVVTQTAQFSR